MPSGRKPQNVEFLNTLRNLMNYSTIGEFADACGKTHGNMHNYLNGKIVPQKNFLRSCLKNLMLKESRVEPMCELHRIPNNKSRISESKGIYIIYDSAAEVLYVGKARNFRKEVWQTLDRRIPVTIRFGQDLRKKKPTIRELATYYSLYEVPDGTLRHRLESLLLHGFVNHTHNTNLGKMD